MSSHNIVHIEIPTSNSEKAARFYSELFGWKITPVPDGNLTLFEPEAGPGGSFITAKENATAGAVLIYVDSEDIDADLKKAELLGAQIILQKSEIPLIGWYGLFLDPTGNTIALYTDIHSD
jgi:uncharacterized protein